MGGSMGSVNERQERIHWPVKQREMQNWAMDSTRWDDFQFRDDDIVVATWAKSGTTWMQQIIGQLVFKGEEDIPVCDVSTWVEFRAEPKEYMLERLEQQEHRRFVKTHLPVDALVFSPTAKYIFIARDGRDTLWSWYNHHKNSTQVGYELVNDTPGRVGPPLGKPNDDIVQYFRDWLEKDGYPCWPFWSHIQSWWDIRDLPNVHLIHFNNLKSDMEGEIRRVAAFLDIEIDDDLWPTIFEHCGFDYMKENAPTLSPFLAEVFHGGAKTFVNKGTNGRWRDVLTPADIEMYENYAMKHLSSDCAHWLATGETR